MGTVYLARSRRGEQAAIKVLRPELALQHEFRERFRREGHAAMRVTSPFTVQVLEVDADANPPFLVAEYVDGPTLLDAVTAHGPLDPESLADFARGVAEALVAIHAAGVTHRDLSPRNVILTPAGPEVIDFGIARLDDATTFTRTGLQLGTPAWMAPEHARGEPVGPAADVFAWGTLVAFAGTGHSPFGAGRPEAVLYRVVHQAPDLRGLDPAIRPLVEAALDKNPDDRPTAPQLLNILERGNPATQPTTRSGDAHTTTQIVDRGRATQPRPTSPTPAPKRRRHKVAAITAATALFVVVTVAAGAFVLTRSSQDSQAQQPAAPRTETQTTAQPPTTITTTTTPTTSATAAIPTSAPDQTRTTSVTTVPSTVANSVPTLGRVWAPNQSGYGEVRPTRVHGGGSPSGLYTDVQWDSWGGEQATGSGIGLWVAPGQATYQGTAEPVRLVAFDLGLCDGQLMYRRLARYFPQHGESFESASAYAQDICT